MVAFNEEGGSPTFQVSHDGLTATRTGLINWSERSSFVNQAFPPLASGGAVDAGALLPGSAILRVKSVNIEPLGERITGPDTDEDFDTLAQYEKARATVQYDTDWLTDQDDPVDFLTHRWSSSGEFLTLPRTSLFWDADSTRLNSNANAGFIIPSTDQQLTWARVLFPPFSVIRDRIGSVNSTALVLPTGTAAPETLLFTGADLERQILSDGARAWKVTYKFSERRVSAQDQSAVGGWNHFFRDEPEKGGFYRVKVEIGSGSFTDVYQLKSFAELFLQGA